MPTYDVFHSCSLTAEETGQLALAITQIHSTSFGVPSLFVSIYFHDVSSQAAYAGGKRRTSPNRITAEVRPEAHSREELLGLLQDISDAWNKVLNVTSSTAGDKELTILLAVPGFTAGIENGLELPKGGDDFAWLKASKAEFERRAQAGQSDFAQLLKELNTLYGI
ncbi:hypothetical protein NA57DRAFT_56126 [Rhizodiscina lignyota]|uniref:Tautomerase cis-CaaD-like domain-containing protein n=1 Tax=Rhizodiscina lignyota TaxID=1504668 RepID=A0A9P4M8L0_9PEZI|nr:hypothetical protein NA57DRAFT_56126 [Rhizodiscina lignyota]